MTTVCPSCSSPDINFEARECRACGIGLPEGSFWTRPRYRGGRASMHADRAARIGSANEHVTKSITGAKS